MSGLAAMPRSAGKDDCKEGNNRFEVLRPPENGRRTLIYYLLLRQSCRGRCPLRKVHHRIAALGVELSFNMLRADMRLQCFIFTTETLMFQSHHSVPFESAPFSIKDSVISCSAGSQCRCSTWHIHTINLARHCEQTFSC